jgi:hypothetical protein
VKLARAHRPGLADRMRRIIGNCLSAWGQAVKRRARERTVGLPDEHGPVHCCHSERSTDQSELLQRQSSSTR